MHDIIACYDHTFLVVVCNSLHAAEIGAALVWTVSCSEDGEENNPVTRKVARRVAAASEALC